MMHSRPHFDFLHFFNRRKIWEDSDQVLVNVTMFQKVLDTFKIKCRERKFIVRDFQYNEQAIVKENEQLKLLEQNKKDKFVKDKFLFGLWSILVYVIAVRFFWV